MISRSFPLSRIPMNVISRPHAVFLSVFLSISSMIPGHGREIRTLLVPGKDDAPEKVFLADKTSIIELELPQRNLSVEQELPNGDLLMAALSKAPVEPAEIPEGFPIVKIPAGWQRCLLIFIPDEGNPAFPYRAIPFDISASKLALGETMVLNLSDTVVSVRLDKERGLVAPAETTTIAAPRPDFGAFPVEIDRLIKGEQKPRAIFRSMWQHDPEARQILFVIPQEGSKTPRIWGLPDTPPPAKE